MSMRNVTTSRHVSRLAPLAVTLLLGGCQTLGSAVGKSFTFEGELPADFKMRAQTHYYVANPDICLGRPSGSQSFENDFQPHPQRYRFRIPVDYYDGTCQMRLDRVGLFVHGRYGELKWQNTYDNGQLLVEKVLPAAAPEFNTEGILHKQAECTWWFQISPLYLQLSKLLNCKGAGAYLLADELPGKTVRLDIRLNPEEEPAHDDTWIKLPEGWKPCLPNIGVRCQVPPIFKTFKMNDRECTVYPNCTE
jgi:hypothetical protein